MPSHIAGAVTPVVARMKKVSQRNAPGAISTMAFIVSPVRPRVGFISTAAFSAIRVLLSCTSLVASSPLPPRTNPCLEVRFQLLPLGREYRLQLANQESIKGPLFVAGAAQRRAEDKASFCVERGTTSI